MKTPKEYNFAKCHVSLPAHLAVGAALIPSLNVDSESGGGKYKVGFTQSRRNEEREKQEKL